MATYWRYLVFLSLVLFYPALSLVWRASYPTFDLGNLLLLLGLLVIAGFLAVLCVSSRPLIRNLLLTLAVTIAVMVQFDLLLEGTLVALVVCGVLMALFGGRVHLLVPVMIALILGALLDTALERNATEELAGTGARNTSLPPVIHLLMDGFIGLDGIPTSAQGQSVKRRLETLLRSRGFQTVPRAFSRYSATVDSLNNAFNFQATAFSKFSVEQVLHSGHEFEENRYFGELAALGYRFNIYQNEEMDFCTAVNGQTDRCWVHALPNLQSMRTNVASPVERAIYLLKSLVSKSYLLRSTVYRHGLITSPGIAVYEPAMFEQMLADISRRADGSFFFAHVLFPHSPFVYGADCVVDYSSETWERFPVSTQDQGVSAAAMQRREERYLEQAECAVSTLEKFFEGLEDLGVLEKSIVLMHGDHGSQVAHYVSRIQNLEKLTPADFRNTYSTLFAVRFPGAGYRAIAGELPLENLMQAFSEQTAGSINEGKGEVVFTPPDSGETPGTVEVYLLGSIPMRTQAVELFKR